MVQPLEHSFGGAHRCRVIRRRHHVDQQHGGGEHPHAEVTCARGHRVVGGQYRQGTQGEQHTARMAGRVGPLFAQSLSRCHWHRCAPALRAPRRTLRASVITPAGATSLRQGNSGPCSGDDHVQTRTASRTAWRSPRPRHAPRALRARGAALTRARCKPDRRAGPSRRACSCRATGPKFARRVGHRPARRRAWPSVSRRRRCCSGTPRRRRASSSTVKGRTLYRVAGAPRQLDHRAARHAFEHAGVRRDERRRHRSPRTR